MNQVWPDFLVQQGAHLLANVVQDFGNAAEERHATQNATVIAPLTHFGVLKVSGEDTQTFLQNLLSSDITAVTPQLAQLSSLNSAKGRVLATLLVWRSANDYFLQLPLELVAPAQKKLAMYVLRAKVKIEDVSADNVCIGLSGNQADALLKNKFESLPDARHAVVHSGGIQIICVDTHRFLLITSPQEARTLWQQLCASAHPVGTSCWDWLDIRSGIPVVTVATQEQFVLQMLNLDVLGGVSFKKGCYPGQEIVARMHYLGKLKRRLYLAHLDAQTAPQAGDELFSNDSEGQTCGMIVNVAPAPLGGYDLLAVVQIATHDEHPVHHGSIQGALLQFQTLPYTLP